MVAMTTDGAEPLALTSSHGGSGAARTQSSGRVRSIRTRIYVRGRAATCRVKTKLDRIQNVTIIGTATCFDFEFYHFYSHFVAYTDYIYAERRSVNSCHPSAKQTQEISSALARRELAEEDHPCKKFSPPPNEIKPIIFGWFTCRIFTGCC